MYKPKLLIALLALPLFTLGQQRLQPDTSINKTGAKSLFVNTGLIYLSDLTYAGRRDPTSVPVLLPTVSLISTKGFFLSAIGYFDVNGSNSQTEGVSFTPGYVFSFDKSKQYGGAISATKYFITANSPIILSTFNATIDGQLHFNPQDIIKLTVAASYRFGKNSPNDVINDLELSKEVWLYKKSKSPNNGFKIIPDLMLYAGTQSFATADTTSSLVGGLVGQNMITTTESRKYELLAFSGSVQFIYAIKTWQINFTPYIIQPYNTGQNGSYFLYTIGVNVTF
ncbi:MAG TPA: hypothetical protein VFE53_06965 [Mucilaginibacter sp.]|jgi:hypothetical protein|nr:hypothetical protein [Mucilaginibacter sp.]